MENSIGQNALSEQHGQRNSASTLFAMPGKSFQGFFLILRPVVTKGRSVPHEDGLYVGAQQIRRVCFRLSVKRGLKVNVKFDDHDRQHQIVISAKPDGKRLAATSFNPSASASNLTRPSRRQSYFAKAATGTLPFVPRPFCQLGSG
jgi:hypothetical protein